MALMDALRRLLCCFGAARGGDAPEATADFADAIATIVFAAEVRLFWSLQRGWRGTWRAPTLNHAGAGLETRGRVGAGEPRAHLRTVSASRTRSRVPARARAHVVTRQARTPWHAEARARVDTSHARARTSTRRAAAAAAAAAAARATRSATPRWPP
jgi:hypothetical protein